MHEWSSSFSDEILLKDMFHGMFSYPPLSPACMHIMNPSAPQPSTCRAVCLGLGSRVQVKPVCAGPFQENILPS